jgi:ribosome recycling factor
MKDEIMSEMREKMEKAAEVLDQEYKKMRTGRASTSILEGIKVDCYGAQMRLNQIASLSSPETKKMAEDSKIIVRNHRREANEMLKELKNEGEISEDDMYAYQDKVQKGTDEFIQKIDEIKTQKEHEILEF